MSPAHQLSLLPKNPAPPQSSADMAGSDITRIIEDSIRNAPRSLQKRIGPSEIGSDCEHCLAARLAGWPQTVPSVAWLPFIGTCVHEHYEQFFREWADTQPALHTGCPVALTEQTVTVGTLDGTPITGSTDLYLPDQLGHATTGMTVDWKIVGKTTLNQVKHDRQPSRRYIVQAMLYAKGWNEAGYPTSHVCVYFQPRNAISLREGYIWTAPYEPGIAQKALDHAQQLLDNLHALETVSTKLRDQWISSLPRASHCWDCAKYADRHQQPGCGSLATALK